MHEVSIISTPLFSVGTEADLGEKGKRGAEDWDELSEEPLWKKMSKTLAMEGDPGGSLLLHNVPRVMKRAGAVWCSEAAS